MAQNKITFSVIKGTGVRRHAETGVMIVKSALGGYNVAVPTRDGTEIVNGAFPYASITTARVAAVREVEAMREVVAKAFDEATELIIAELAEIEPQVEAYGNRALSVLHWSATHAVVRPLFAHLPSTAASASRLHRIKAVLAGTETMISDAEAEATLKDALERYTLGTAVVSARHGGAPAVVSSEAYLIAESNEVVLQIRIGRNYASVYARDLTR